MTFKPSLTLMLPSAANSCLRAPDHQGRGESIRILRPAQLRHAKRASIQRRLCLALPSSIPRPSPLLSSSPPRLIGFHFRIPHQRSTHSLPRNISMSRQHQGGEHGEESLQVRQCRSIVFKKTLAAFEPPAVFQDLSLQSLQWLESRGLYGTGSRSASRRGSMSEYNHPINGVNR